MKELEGGEDGYGVVASVTLPHLRATKKLTINDYIYFIDLTVCNSSVKI